MPDFSIQSVSPEAPDPTVLEGVDTSAESTLTSSSQLRLLTTHRDCLGNQTPFFHASTTLELPVSYPGTCYQ